MKIIVAFFALTFFSTAARAQQTPAQLVAIHQAQALQDSLGLSVQLRDSIYNCNMRIFSLKKAARQKYLGDMDETRSAVQIVENTRDSLYRNILPADKYNAYLSKKVSLLKP